MWATNAGKSAMKHFLAFYLVVSIYLTVTEILLLVSVALTPDFVQHFSDN